MYAAMLSSQSLTTCARRISLPSWQSLDVAFEPLKPVQDGCIFARWIGMAEAGEFMISDVVPPLAQLLHDQTDVCHRKKLILGAMRDVNGQVLRLDTALVGPHYPSHDC